MIKKQGREQVNRIIEKYRIKIHRYKINKDGLIDVIGDVLISNTKLRKLPIYFGTVSGSFVCNSNQLRSLRGAPHYVGRNFHCRKNELISLLYAPKFVGGDFDCSSNKLESLKGVPNTIYGGFYCVDNKLINLKYGPEKVANNYNVDRNYIKNLLGSPFSVGGNFYSRKNTLESLQGCSIYIGGILYLSSCVKNVNIGNEDCFLTAVQIRHVNENGFPYLVDKEIFVNQKYLAVVMKYHSVLELWNVDGVLNNLNFKHIISDIKEGLK